MQSFLRTGVSLLALGNLTVHSTVLSINISIEKYHLFHEVSHDATHKFSVILQDFVHPTILVCYP